jgi:hypothetical protein
LELAAFDTGVVEREVESAEPIDRLAHELRNAGRVRDIRRDEMRVDTQLGEIHSRLLPALDVDISYRDVDALTSEGQRRGPADTRSRARDDRDLALHGSHTSLLFSDSCNRRPARHQDPGATDQPWAPKVPTARTASRPSKRRRG